MGICFHPVAAAVWVYAFFHGHCRSKKNKGLAFFFYYLKKERRLTLANVVMDRNAMDSRSSENSCNREWKV